MREVADPSKTIRIRKKVRALVKGARWDEAQQVQSQYLAQYPNDPDGHHRMGQIAVGKKDLSGALSSFKRAHELAPEEPQFASALARLYGDMNDKKNAVVFKKKAKELLPSRLQTFQQQQIAEKAAALARVRSALARCLQSWPHAISRDPNTPIADRLLEIHPMDKAALWIRYIPQVRQPGEVVELEGIGRFLVGDQNQTLHKRLCRGIPWELPAVALFMELASRADPKTLLIDIGANIGTHTVALARQFAGTVLAFEPVPLSHAFLLENLFLNNLSNTIPLQKACSATAGTGRMTRIEENNPGKARLDAASSTGSVEITTLDTEVSRLGRQAAFIKIDVEGHESDVFAGAQDTIRRHRPIIFTEILSAEKSAAVMKTFSDFGYELHNFTGHDYLLIPQ